LPPWEILSVLDHQFRDTIIGSASSGSDCFKPDPLVVEINRYIGPPVCGRACYREGKVKKTYCEVHLPPPLMEFNLEFVAKTLGRVRAILQPHALEPLTIRFSALMVANPSIQLVFPSSRR
jgi:hypothetical protein